MNTGVHLCIEPGYAYHLCPQWTDTIGNQRYLSKYHQQQEQAGQRNSNSEAIDILLRRSAVKLVYVSKCVGVVDMIEHTALTLHIDGEGACEEERLEGWHGPTGLAVAQLLWNRLLSAHSRVSAGQRGLNLGPTAAGQARTG